LKLGKVTVKDKTYFIQRYVEALALADKNEEVLSDNDKMTEDDESQESDSSILNPEINLNSRDLLRFDINLPSNKLEANTETAHKLSEKSEPIIAKANRKLYYEIPNSHDFPFYLYECCSSLYDNLKLELAQKFQFRIFKLEKNFLIESRYERSGTPEEGNEVINNVLNYLNEFNQKNFAQHEINENLDNKYFWYFLKETIFPSYIDRKEISLIIRDENNNRFFRIDGTNEAIAKEKKILGLKIENFYQKLEKLETNGPGKESLFYESSNKSSCSLQ
jgi:hypothetical protein